MPGAGDERERRLVAEVVLDVGLGHARAVQFGGEGSSLPRRFANARAASSEYVPAGPR